MDNKQIIDDFKKRFQLPDKTFIDHSYPPHEEGEMDKWFGTLLQKARQDWLREEIVRLKSEFIDEQLINKEGWHRRNSQWIIGMNEAFQTIIDRYHSELDQDKK